MNKRVNNGRKLIFAAVALALVAGSGCGMFRSKNGYELSPESRPLEIPPELNAPSTDTSLRIPDVTVRTAARTVATTSQAFVLEDSAASAWDRVGLALDRIDGVSIGERSKLLTVYTVSYEGDTFMIRIAAHENGARVAATTTEGREITDGAGARLLGLLHQRLG